MCGQVGIIFGKKRRRVAEREYLCEIFTSMMLMCEERGPHASGAAWLNDNGLYRLFKRPIRAHRLIDHSIYLDMLSEVDNHTTVLMGHTRWRTRGSETNNCNNHPIRSGIILGTHNGTIYNANALFRRLGLPRFVEVDSELIFRLADRFTPDQAIDLNGFCKVLRRCRGQISAVLVSRLDPGSIIILKGNKPLSLRIHPKFRVVIYASNPEYIDAALDSEKGWHELEIPPMTILTFKQEHIRHFDHQPFHFTQEERKRTLPKGVIA